MERKIQMKNSGMTKGSMTRLVSPRHGGEWIKPFVLLDYLEGEAQQAESFTFHSHSGIATLTYPLQGKIEYEESMGELGYVEAEGIEWMLSGGGSWHRSHFVSEGKVALFQLWIALPPKIEDGESMSLLIPPEDIPSEGPVRVLLGSYGQERSQIGSPSPINYFSISLSDKEHWSYQPPSDHQVAWVFAYQGSLKTSGSVLTRELAIYEEGGGALQFEADGETRFLLGTAAKHEYPLVVGIDTIHTNEKSMILAAERKERLGKALRG